ncbi:MAG: hypothetical protein AAB527_03630 [Patescibacteria group bacterium]
MLKILGVGIFMIGFTPHTFSYMLDFFKGNIDAQVLIMTAGMVLIFLSVVPPIKL